ncbi:hypothetical protein ABBQ38_015465 [Trebouxia sp. C0009 RCD-2024]
MGSYQGSDWFKSGAHVRVSPAESKQQLVHQASQQLAEYSKKLQVAYDGGLALFKNNFSGTDAQIEQAQQTLSAIVAVSKNLQDLHQRLASSLMVSKSDTALNYAVDGVEQHTAEVLTLLKKKEERLQIEVNKCAELRTENLMLTKQLQGLTSSRQHSNTLSDGVLGGSIPAGRKASQLSSMDRAASHSPSSTAPVVLTGVLSLANAGSWLHLLRSKLSSNTDRRWSDYADGRDGTASETYVSPQQQEDQTFDYPLPIRRSRSDALHDRHLTAPVCRRGSEMGRATSADLGRSMEGCDEAMSAVRARDRRRRTHVLMEDVGDADQGAPVHFLTPELAARSALFGGVR